MAIRPTFMGFETAGRGIMLNQKALDIVANNVGNIGVTGYTRQRVDQVSMAINHRDTRYHTKTALMGQGAGISGISQIRDPFLDKRYREETSDVAYYQTTSEVLEDITVALDEIEPEQMNEALYSLQVAWNELIKEGGSSEAAAAEILAASRSVVQVIQQLDAKLHNVWQQQHYNLTLDVDDVNTILEQIVQYNDAIRKESLALDFSNTGYYQPNELLDQRNVLIDTLATYADVLVTEHADGSVDISIGGHMAVKGLEHDVIGVYDGPSDETVKVVWNSTGADATVSGGKLKAYTDMLNGRGLEMKADRGEAVYNGIRYYQDKIDKMATVLADTFNSVLPIANEDGTPSGTYKTLFTYTDHTDPGAGTITINPTWAADVSYLFSGIVQDGVNDTTYAEFVNTFFDESQANLNFGEFTGSFNEYVTFYSVTQLGVQKADADTRLDACLSVVENLEDRIATISGVSLEEEATDTMRYTKAYNAMSRVMTALDDALDRLINNTGRVGL